MEKIQKTLEMWDEKIITCARRLVLPFSRFAIFLIYFWFGALKIFGESPANPLVANLLLETMPGISFESFIGGFGVIEMVIGLLFIIPHLQRLAVFALILHLITTIMPLFLLPEVSWHGFLVPTLEGQYMIKNILLLSLGILVLSRLNTFEEEKKSQNV